jgi:putative phosphoribosyl transferase
MALERYRNRRAAGKRLAELLGSGLSRAGELTNPIVLALPRGGVPVAYEVAKHLQAPLDVFIVRKLGVPGHEELAMGAVASGGLRVFNETVLNQINLAPQDLARSIAHAEDEVHRRELVYRGERSPVDVRDRDVIVVDDGLATGSTMLAAIRTLRQQHPARIIAAVPVSPGSTADAIAREVDDMVCVRQPEPFYGVGQWYDDFEQTSDQEVHDLLDQARAAFPSSSSVPAYTRRPREERASR